MSTSKRSISSTAGLAVLAFFLARTEAFTTTGASLAYDQRDVRVFDNFVDPTANDNTTSDPDFPGATGAELAIWKAVVEWQSGTHGSGGGDPHQPGDIGSGGANFDPSWQGLAASVGGPGDNVASALAGSGGAVLAFLETGPGGGWRMRFYESATWEDGPGMFLAPGRVDLQATATALYGRALGLGDSSVPGATMWTGIDPTGVERRSIEVDDSLGVQAIYGVASPARPVIHAVAAAPGTITITGANFASGNNEVWFTRVAPNTTGDPVVATGVTSNGTSIVIALPFAAGPGDVLVRKPGAGLDRLSNAYPFAPDCPAPVNSCQTSPNSVDPVGARMGWSGSTSVARNDLVLTATALPPNTSGRFYFGANAANVPFGNGFRCVGAPFVRLPVQVVSPSGTASAALDMTMLPVLGQVVPGATRYFQFWYRNPAAGGAGFNLSDALTVFFCP